MKKKATTLLKQIMAVLSSIAKATSMNIKNKTNAAKARLVMFSLTNSRSCSKVHSLHDDVDSNQTRPIVLHDAMANEAHSSSNYTQMVDFSNPRYYCDDYDDDDYPDLRHSLCDEDLEFSNPRYYYDDDEYPCLGHSLSDKDLEFEDGDRSIIKIVRSSKEAREEFKMEDENIDHLADMFIERFHERMLMQQLESFKRHQIQEMLPRGV